MAITPDPFNIKLKSSVLDPIPQENCREAGTCYSKRQKGFVTRKTPEPYFNGRLLLDNGVSIDHKLVIKQDSILQFKDISFCEAGHAV